MTSRTIPNIAIPPLRKVATALAWLCVFTTLALLSPGVVLTASGEEPLEAGPSCSADAGARETSLLELQQAMEAMRARAAQAIPGDDEVVVLNNRGYFYGPDPGAPPPELETPRR